MLGHIPSGIPVVTRSAEERRRRILVPLAVVAVLGLVFAALVGFRSGPTGQILGSGSTAAQPLIQNGATRYRNATGADNPERPGTTGDDWVLDGGGVDYEPVGSLGGIMRLSSPDVDFAVSDYPLQADELASRNVAQFPLVVGSIAVVHNAPLPTGTTLTLDAPTLAAIYSGKVKNWNDPAVAALNPGLQLPSTPITPVRRAEGSGSTYGFTTYLRSAGNRWPHGAGSTIDWPRGVGVTATRTSGMADAVMSTAGAVGYVESGQAERAGLRIASVKNAAGQAVTATPESMTAAMTSLDLSGQDHYSEPLAAPTEPTAYPITVPIYALVEKNPPHRDATRASLSFLAYLIENYDAEAQNLGYVPLPEDGARQVFAYWDANLASLR